MIILDNIAQSSKVFCTIALIYCRACPCSRLHSELSVLQSLDLSRILGVKYAVSRTPKVLLGIVVPFLCLGNKIKWYILYFRWDCDLFTPFGGHVSTKSSIALAFLWHFSLMPLIKKPSVIFCTLYSWSRYLYIMTEGRRVTIALRESCKYIPLDFPSDCPLFIILFWDRDENMLTISMTQYPITQLVGLCYLPSAVAMIHHLA